MIIEFIYTNHKNETRKRRVQLGVLEWLDNDVIHEYGYERGLFFTGFDLDKAAFRSFSVKRMVPVSGSTIIFEMNTVVDAVAIDTYTKEVMNLLDSINKDMHGTPIGRFQDGNGGLISTDTLKMADKLRRTTQTWDISRQRNKILRGAQKELKDEH